MGAIGPRAALDLLLKPYDVGELLMRSWVLLETRQAFQRRP